MRVDLKGVYASHKILSNGAHKTYYCWRGGGSLNPLPGDEAELFAPGTPAFMRAYQAAIDAPRKARTVGTLKSVIDGYLKWPAYAKLAPRTKVDYLYHLARIERAVLLKNGPELATYPLDAIDDPKIRRRFLDWRDKLAKAHPGKPTLR